MSSISKGEFSVDPATRRKPPDRQQWRGRLQRCPSSPAPGAAVAFTMWMCSSKWTELSKDELAYAPAVRDLLADAERSDQAGDLEGASRKYRDAFEMAMKIPPDERSEKLQKELAVAQVAWRAVTYQRQSSLHGDTSLPSTKNSDAAMNSGAAGSRMDETWEGTHKKE